MRDIELVVVVAEASDGETVWARRLAMRAEDWAVNVQYGLQQDLMNLVTDQLRREVPDNLGIFTYMTTETMRRDENDG